MTRRRSINFYGHVLKESEDDGQTMQVPPRERCGYTKEKKCSTGHWEDVFAAVTACRVQI
jgi:hypothetical protein